MASDRVKFRRTGRLNYNNMESFQKRSTPPKKVNMPSDRKLKKKWTSKSDNAGTWLITFSLAQISCFWVYNLSLVLVVLVFSSDIVTELVTIETTQRGGSSGYWRCRCRTLLYPQPFVYWYAPISLYVISTRGGGVS